ncbi:MAG: hypothetical protein ABIJ53_00985 [Verrucomicrobiota bacterium]
MDAKNKATEGFYRKFLQIPGPNPLLIAGGKDTWDERRIECGDVFKDQHTYYLYYHGMPKNAKLWPTPGRTEAVSYRIGVATASHPLGPWKKYEKNPIIDTGPKGSWEDGCVACPHIIKEKGNIYYLWYSAIKSNPGLGISGTLKMDIGLATASHPLGPWKKYEGNPVITNFGYIGSVLKINGKYYMYTEYPVGASSPDEGPMCLTIADRPEGPWKPYEGNPVLAPDDWGSWDDGGYSEGKVVYHDGMFHMFYGGTKWMKLERIGYAYSYDGFHFTKYPGNPIALTEHSPNSEAFAEVHAWIEPPLVYLYHTIRYKNMKSEPSHLGQEDIGVQVMATENSFRFAMPLLQLGFLEAKKQTSLDLCPPVRLEHVESVVLTIEAKYHPAAKRGLCAHVFGSSDGMRYDTEDLYMFKVPLKKGKSVCKSIELCPQVMYLKVVLENLDKSKKVSSLAVTATLGKS